LAGKVTRDGKSAAAEVSLFAGAEVGERVNDGRLCSRTPETDPPIGAKPLFAMRPPTSGFA